ncbi:MAG: SpoIIE family protein phosphatase [Psychrosphaera sp.]|nr:SpoIIE family protein phosphatase [Psychrosphaera sp.]
MSWQFDIAAAIRPRGDEAVGGDMTFIETCDKEVRLLCMDVLGHGPKAHEVAQVAAQQLAKISNQQQDFNPDEVLLDLDQLLRGMRGAAVAACLINRNNGQMTFAGVGNISVRRIFPKSSTLVSRDGVVGGNMRKPRPVQVNLEPGDIYLMHTDGIKSRFAHRDYPHIVSDNAATAAAHVLKHFSKQHDDAGCIVFKVT